MDLREYLFKKRMSVSDFAKKINFARTYISGIISGANKPSKKLAKIIEEATNGEVTAEELLSSKSNS